MAQNREMTWIALLRGVNVGGRAKVPMADLRALFEQLGFADVRTYIQSGNVLFEGKPEREAIERAVRERFGVPAAVLLRTGEQLERVVAGHPFGADTSRTNVAFLAERPPAAAVRALAAVDSGDERVDVAGDHVYLHYPDGYGRARLTGALVERHLGPATVRNWRTVTTLAELAR